MSPRVQHSAVFFAKRAQHELSRRNRCAKKRLILEHHGRASHRVDHQPVPAREDLVVFAGTNSLITNREQLLLGLRHLLAKLIDIPTFDGRTLFQRLAEIWDVLAFEVAMLGDVEDVAELLRKILSKNTLHFVDGPDIELAFFSFAIGIFGAVETTSVVRHVLEHVVTDLFRDNQVTLVAGRGERIHIGVQQQRVVVQHLFKVRHQPTGIDAVPSEPASQMVVDASIGHAVERLGGGFEQVRVAFAVSGPHA